MPLKPVCLDLSSHNPVASFEKIKAAGIEGVILKATQSTRFVDKTFAERLPAAKAAGLLVGAYHFASGMDVEDQVTHFLSTVGETEDVLLALDYEPNPNGSTMSLEQARQFLKLVYERTGQRPLLYSGHLLKDQLRGRRDEFLASHRLWLAHYGVAKPKIPPGWDNYWLWQYADTEKNFPGIKGGNVDVNVFGGSDMAAEWIDRGDAPAVATADEAPAVVARADPEGAESAWDRFSFAKVNQLADQGSRVAGWIRSAKRWLWGTAATAGGAATLVDTKQGSANVFVQLVSDHPFMAMAIFGAVVGLGVYLFVKFIEKGLVSAARDGRYRPRGV